MGNQDKLYDFFKLGMISRCLAGFFRFTSLALRFQDFQRMLLAIGCQECHILV
jgi:hypothetical protein